MTIQEAAVAYGEAANTVGVLLEQRAKLDDEIERAKYVLRDARDNLDRLIEDEIG